MSFLGKLIGSIILLDNLFVEKDYSLPVETKVLRTEQDAQGRPVIVMQAANYKEAARPIEGTTYPGAVYRSVEKTNNKYEWKIKVNDFDTQ